MEQRNELASQPLLLTIPQVATKLGLSRAMVYNLINRESLPVIHLGRAVRVSTASLQKWVEEREESAREKRSRVSPWQPASQPTMPVLLIVIKSNFRQYSRWFTAASLTSMLESISSSGEHSAMLDLTDRQNIFDKLPGNSPLKE